MVSSCEKTSTKSQSPSPSLPWVPEIEQQNILGSLFISCTFNPTINNCRMSQRELHFLCQYEPPSFWRTAVFNLLSWNCWNREAWDLYENVPELVWGKNSVTSLNESRCVILILCYLSSRFSEVCLPCGRVVIYHSWLDAMVSNHVTCTPDHVTRTWDHVTAYLVGVADASSSRRRRYALGEG